MLAVESSADLFVELVLDGFVETVDPLLDIVGLLGELETLKVEFVEPLQ